MKVRISITDPWDLGAERQWRPLYGELVRLAESDRGGYALIRLDEPIVHKHRSWKYLRASPRSVGDVMSSLERGAEVFSAIIGVADEQAESADTLAAAVRKVAEFYFIGTVCPEDAK